MHTISWSTNWKGKLFWHVNSSLSKLKSVGNESDFILVHDAYTNRPLNHVYLFRSFDGAFVWKLFKLFRNFLCCLKPSHGVETKEFPFHPHTKRSHLTFLPLSTQRFKEKGKESCEIYEQTKKRNAQRKMIVKVFHVWKIGLKANASEKRNFYHHVHDANKKGSGGM